MKMLFVRLLLNGTMEETSNFFESLLVRANAIVNGYRLHGRRDTVYNEDEGEKVGEGLKGFHAPRASA